MSCSRNYHFTEDEKISIDLGNLEDVEPYDIFCLIITDDIIEMIVTETSRYASDFISNTTMTRDSRLKSWKETNNEEMKRFIGIIKCMGLVSIPEMHLYWSKDDKYN